MIYQTTKLDDIIKRSVLDSAYRERWDYYNDSIPHVINQAEKRAQDKEGFL